AADHDRDLDAGAGDVGDLLRDRVDDIRIDADRTTAEHLAAQFQQHPPVATLDPVTHLSSPPTPLDRFLSYPDLTVPRPRWTETGHWVKPTPGPGLRPGRPRNARTWSASRRPRRAG